jgi:L-cystine uptake protein TcyP (sodium:dicarboxylate symporter family)
VTQPENVSFFLFFPVSAHTIPVIEKMVDKLGVAKGSPTFVAFFGASVGNNTFRGFILFCSHSILLYYV